jgi:hypothetical protein
VIIKFQLGGEDMLDSRQKLLNRLNQDWSSFMASYSDLAEKELQTPGVIGLWSIKDIIAHVTTWEEEALKYLPIILHGKRPPRYSVQYGGIDAFNAQTAANKKNLSLAEVLREQDLTHRELTKLIEKAPQEHLESRTRFWRRLRQDTYGHYRIHTAAIQKWRETLNV